MSSSPMRALLAVALAALCSCAPSEAPDKWGLVIPEARRDAAAEFMIRLCEASNPHSDEEPEDMIAEAWRATVHLYGERTLGRNSAANSGEFVFVPWPETSESPDGE